MADLFGIGISGLLTAQHGLTTTGHNIANAATPGYSRQRAELGTRPAQEFGFGFLGSGVEVETVRRVFDGFLAEQVRATTASAAHMERFHDLAAQVDNLLAAPASGLSPTLQEFFGALHDLADDPSSIPARQVVLGEAQTLVNRFHSLDSRFQGMHDGVNEQVTGIVGEVNALASEIADLNKRIVFAQNASGDLPNDLLDQRDERIRQLSERIDVDPYDQGDGAINITIGGGQTLVVGSTVSAQLSAAANPFNPTRLEVGYTASGVTTIISDRINGGTLAGVLDFRRQVLDPAQDGLGLVALGVAETVNAQHRLGVDLDGIAGSDFFGALGNVSAAVLPDAANTGAPAASISASISDVGQLSAAGYQLDRIGAAFTLTRLSDNTVISLNTFPTAAETVDGITLSLSAGTIAAGDSFFIQPSRGAASDITLAIASPQKIASAAPIRTAATLANTGSGQISAGLANAADNVVSVSFTSPTTFDVSDSTTGATLATGLTYTAGAPISFNGWTLDITGAPNTGDVFSVDHTVTSAAAGNTGSGVVSTATVSVPDTNLTDPVTITFGTPPNTFTVTGATTGIPTVNVPYTSGAPLSFNGWTLNISGNPDAGDTFTVTANTSGVGDNRNALLIADLQAGNSLKNRNATFAEAYSQVVSEVGTVTQRAESGRAAQSVLLDHAVEAHNSVSGVNLDEEAANLLRLQQAYQANAQVISIANEIFDSLLAAVGR